MAAWYRHFDFILIDLFCMQAALAIAYSFRNGWSMIFEESYYSRMAVTLMILQLIVVFFCESYSGIMKRSHFEEFKQTLFFASEFPYGYRYCMGAGNYFQLFMQGMEKKSDS